MTQWIWVHLEVATLLAITWLVLDAHVVAQEKPVYAVDDKKTGICQRKYIRNDPINLESLRGCKVIEGSLQLALMNADSPDNWTQYRYPELKEITGYLLIFEISSLTSLQNIFPNLAVIRGQELIDTHALIINGATHLQEIGLPSLTDIQRGSTWIVENPQLCYVDTIDWPLISNESSIEGINGNKPSNQCPNSCNQKCFRSEFDQRQLCWGSSSSSCQKVFNKFCPICHGKPCTAGGECCSHQCLGGCNGTSPRDCFVCKNVIYNGTCMEECPHSYYEYLQRRCVTRDECLKIIAAPDVSRSSTPQHGKLYEDTDGKKLCILECPKNTELASDKKSCVPCKGACKKNCSGMLVDSIEKARELAGCTRITGVLKISIRRSGSVATGTIVKELKQNLDKIEEIEDYLVITHTYAIFSLDFLENLKVIHGKNLEDQRYALVLRSNENLMQLWDSNDRKVKIENKNARVLFHYNPKLCPRIIWDFVVQSGIPRPKDDKIDIGITNGDKVTCNTHVLEVEIEKKTNNSVLIRYENFRRNLSYTSHLLNYEIHYKEAVNYPAKNVSKFDDRDPCGEDDWTVLEYPKIKDDEVRYELRPSGEPQWEHSRLIANLKHYAWYALYVKTIVIPDENSLNNNTGAESNIIYFQTLPGVPSKPQEFKLAAAGSDKITLSWTPPLHPNGELEKFTIFLEPVYENQKLQDQRNYCNQGRVVTKAPSTAPGKSSQSPFLLPSKDGETVTLSTIKPKDADCCSCGGKTTPPSYAFIHYKDDMVNQIMTRVFISQPDTSSQDSSANDPDNNDIRRLKRSIRRSLEDSSDNSGEKINDKVFPGEKSSPGLDKPRVPPEMRKVAEIKVGGERKYSFTLKNLTHFTTYFVGIQACRFTTNSTEMENDTGTCSELARERIQTLDSPTADNIDPSSISINVTESNKLHLTWAEPASPNGVVLAYKVQVQKVEGSKYVGFPISDCVTRKKFQGTRNFTFLHALPPGNYSVRIQVASLAKDSEWTKDVYVSISDAEGSMSGLWALIILMPILFMITIGSLLAYYYIRTKDIGARRIISANPEYMSNVDIPEEWEVPRDNLEILKANELGQGSFGTVYEGILKDFIHGVPLMRCAVKTVSEDTLGDDRALFLREAALMVKLNCHCHHVVKLLGVVSKTHPTYVVMELMTRGDLKNFLRSRRPGTYNNGDPPPTLRQILRMAAEIADGMAYIHKNKLVHRDLAARNCMVGEDMVVKVGDFGMTKEMLQSDYYRKQTRGLLPVRWMAPESLRDGVFTNQTDVWSFGVVLWEMATLAAQPYQGLSNSQVLEYVVSGRTMERPENCPDILFDLMTWCWQVDYRHRPNFIQILERLSLDLDPSFAQVSFYNSPEGLQYQDQLKLQKDDALIEIRFDSLTPLATLDDDDDDLDEYDSDEELHHHIVDDLGDTPSRLLLSNPPATITSSRNPSSLLNGLALNPLVIHSPRNDVAAHNSDSINLANHAIPAPTSTSTAYNSYSSTPRANNSSSDYSPRPRTNSNNNNTNPRLPITLNLQNNVACINNVNNCDGSSGSGIPVSGTTTGSSSSLSSSNNFTSPIPNGVDSLVSNSFHHQHNNHPAVGTTSSPKCSLNNSGDSSKVEQSKTNAFNSSGSTDNSQALLINYSGDGSKISNGNGGGTGGNGYTKRRNSPIHETQPVNRTTQC